MPRSKNRFLAYFILLINTALWGFSAPIIKYSFSFTSPNQFLFYRFLFAALLFTPIFLFYRRRHQTYIRLFPTLIIALLGTPLCLIPLFYGLNLTSSVEASILESTSPLFTIIMCLIFLKETVTKTEWRGLVVALLGTFIIVLEPLLTGHNHVQLSIAGNLLIVTSNVIWTLFILLSKKTKTDPVYLTYLSFLISIPIFLFLSLGEKTGLSLNTLALPGILYMTIAGSIIGFWTYLEGQKRIEASEAAVFTYLKPAFALPLSILWLKETFSPLAIVAALLIVLGVFISEKR